LKFRNRDVTVQHFSFGCFYSNLTKYVKKNKTIIFTSYHGPSQGSVDIKFDFAYGESLLR
jgi:hypothetical protein